MTSTPLPYPRRGLDENRSHEQQPLETTGEMLNMRPVDPTNGRTRGAQRAGMRKHIETALGSAVRVVRAAVYESKAVAYEALQGDLDTDPDLELISEEWATKTKAYKSVLNVETDLSGNVYAISGNTVEKRNPDKALLWTFAVPLADSKFTIGPLVIDEVGGVYVAVDGGDAKPKGAAVYKIEQQQIANSFDTEPVLAWTWTLDLWCRELALHSGTLKMLVQDNLAHISKVRTLVNVNLAIPDEIAPIVVPYPSTCMAVKADGSVVTGHPALEGRDTNPLFPGIGVPLEQWNLGNLSEDDAVVWADLRAEDIVGDDGDMVTAWFDVSGNGRNLYEGHYPNGQKNPVPPPTIRKVGSTGTPSVYFNGMQGLFSLPGGGTDAQRDNCLSLVPNHGDGAFCIFILCRPETSKATDEIDGVDASIDATRWLFGQLHHSKFQGDATGSFDTGYTEAHRTSIFVNSKVLTTPTATTAYTWSGVHDQAWGEHAPGYLRAITSSTGATSIAYTDATGGDDELLPANRGAGTAGWPIQGQFDDPAADSPGEGLCLITMMNCGGLNEYKIAVDGVYLTGVSFTATSGTPFASLDIGEPVHLWIDGNDVAMVVFSGTVLTYTSGSAPSATYTDCYLVRDRNLQTRSLLRINGNPIDRWEALPLSFAGASGALGVRTAEYDTNITSNPTGVGVHLDEPNVKGFKGEIMRILVVGRRKKNGDRILLGSSYYHEYPTVLSHPFYANNQMSGESDATWVSAGSNVASTTMEKIEGYIMHGAGLHKKLPTTGYPHAHAVPYTSISGYYDLPLFDTLAQTGQAWLPNKRQDAAMWAKHDSSGKMLWCLLASGVYGNGDGTLFSEDYFGAGPSGSIGVSAAPCTGGIVETSTGDLYIAGPGEGSNADEFALGIIYDKPESDRQPGLTVVGFWSAVGVPDEFRIGFEVDKTIRLKRDEFDTLYVPMPSGTTYGGVAAKDAIRVFGRADPDDPMEFLFRLTTLGGTDKYQAANAVALPPTNPIYTT